MLPRQRGAEFEFSDAAEDASPQPLLAQFAQPLLDEIEPRGAERGESTLGYEEGMMPYADESWSQGRLAPAVLSRGTDRGLYIHEYIRASTVEQVKGAFGMGASQDRASRYPAANIETHLNERGSEGWRLVSMEPHWWYEQQTISGVMSITRPLAIVGWYLTFERRE